MRDLSDLLQSQLGQMVSLAKLSKLGFQDPHAHKEPNTEFEKPNDRYEEALLSSSYNPSLGLFSVTTFPLFILLSDLFHFILFKCLYKVTFIQQH